MMAYEGTVVGLKKRSAVVMTVNCQFKEIKRTPTMFSGQMVRFTDADLVKPALKAPVRFTAIAASLLVCLVLAYSLLQGFMDKRAFAYISLEVNPALEIALDQEMKVLQATGLNPDGRDLVRVLNIRGQDAAEAVEAVLSTCMERGYINADRRVLLATTFTVKNDSLQVELDHRLWEAVHKSVTGSPGGVRVYLFHVDPALREQAVEKGVSAARYLLWQDAQADGLQCDLDGPLSGPAFNRSAAKLSISFMEGPDSPDITDGPADQTPLHSPDHGEVLEKHSNPLRGGVTLPDSGAGSGNGKEQRGGRPGGTGDTAPEGPGGTDTRKDQPATTSENIKDRPDSVPAAPPGSVNGKGPVTSSDVNKPVKDSSSVDNTAGGGNGGSSSIDETSGQGSGSSSGSSSGSGADSGSDNSSGTGSGGSGRKGSRR